MKKLIERDLFSKLTSWINQKEIFIIIGPRQAGKTTLFLMLKDFLIKKKKVNPASVFYFSFEDPEVRFQFNQNPKEFIESKIKNLKGKIWMFLDEYHWIEEGGQKLKFIYDFYPQIKLFVTSSSSLELTFKTAQYLVGRCFYFHLYPLSFSEFLRYKNKEIFNSYQERQENLWKFIQGKKKTIDLTPSIYENNLSKMFEEYVVFGGYPEVVKKREKELKKITLGAIIATYLEREIRSLLLIEDLASYRKFLQILSTQIGQIINYQQLSSDSGLYFKLLKKYLNILEETFVIKSIQPFFKNLSSELRKNPKIYFVDSGLRNSLINEFGSLSFRVDKGALVENFVFSELLKKGEKINFWRTKAKAEVDFILKKEPPFPLEVKFQKMKKFNLSRSFLSFLEIYRPKRALVLTNQSWGKVKYRQTLILFVPVWYI